jgi:hypothetical protein
MRRNLKIALAIAMAVEFVVPAAGAMALDMEGFLMSAGRMIVVKGETRTLLDHEAVLSDGTKVEPDGTINFVKGQPTRLENGQMIMSDGHIVRGGKAVAMHR